MRFSSIQDAWVAAHNHDDFTAEIASCTWEDALMWLESVQAFPKVVWHGRHEAGTYFGIGMTTSEKQSVALTVRSFDASEPQWTNFPNSLTIHPQHLLKWTPKGCTLESFSFSVPFPNSHGLDPQDIRELPTKPEWAEKIEHCKTLFQRNTLQKIVLARQSCFDLSNPWNKFRALYNTQQHCYHFLVQPTAERCFFGASPEKLFSKNSDTLETEALAGTAPISGNDEQDQQLATELLESQKNQAEHHIVLRYLHTQLSDLEKSHHTHPQDLVTLSHVQHLRTRVSYQIQSSVSLDQIIDRLHPTPAVCGLPSSVARREISRIEPFHRGWYAGTMGLINRENANFTVLIRSALWIQGQGYTWSGAGIVAGSEPVAEWNEINNKAKQFLG